MYYVVNLNITHAIYLLIEKKIENDFVLLHPMCFFLYDSISRWVNLLFYVQVHFTTSRTSGRNVNNIHFYVPKKEKHFSSVINMTKAGHFSNINTQFSVCNAGVSNFRTLWFKMNLGKVEIYSWIFQSAYLFRCLPNLKNMI